MRSTVEIIAVGLFLSLLRGYAFAYDEPDNFAGLKFGQDLTKQMRPCRLVKDTEYGERCYVDGPADGIREGDSFTLRNVVDFLRHDPEARQLNGKLAMVSFTFNNRTGEDETVLAILTRRYGAPTEQRQEPWVSRAGVRTTNLNVTWEGKNVTIFFEERGSTIDQGHVTYVTRAWIDHLRKRQAEKAKKGASGL